MRDPKIKVGFVIFNEDWKEELEWHNGHRKTAFEWLKKHRLLNLYNSMLGQNGIYDEEDFLVDYIGAVKLYCTRGQFYCRIPKIPNPDKSYLKHYFKERGYNIVESTVIEEQKQKVKKFEYPYNQTVIKTKNTMCYNPQRDGD